MKRIKQESEQLFEFCPGNGTRYKLYAAKVDTDARGCFNLIVAWLKRDDMGGSACLMDSGMTVDLGYFMAKTDHHAADAVAILCFMRERFGVKIRIPAQFEEKKWVADGKRESL